MKKIIFCLIIGLVLSPGFIFAQETLTAKQKEARGWIEKADKVNTLTLKIKYYNKAIEVDSEYKTYSIYYSRGLAYRLLGQNEKALDDYTKAISLNPTALAYGARGYANLSLGNNEEAINDLTSLTILRA